MFEFDYQKEVDAGYVAKRHHPKNEDIVILNYTDECVYERKWNEATLACRGYIVNEKTGEILARPFGKFFNYSEEAGIDLTPPEGKPTIAVKLDGSLGISYVLDGEIKWSTRGSFVSEQAGIAQRIWDKKYKHVQATDLENITLMVEIIDQQTRVVVDYEGESDLILIGARKIKDGYDFSHEELVELAERLGMKVTDKTPFTVEEVLKKRTKIGFNEEGWVLRWDNGFRLKVKGEEYLKLHKIMYGLSDKQKVKSWMENELENLMRQVPEEFRKEIEQYEIKLDKKKKEILKEVEEFYLSIPKELLSKRKEVATYIIANGKREYIDFYFKLLDGKEIENNVKKYIFKHYREFLGEG